MGRKKFAIVALASMSVLLFGFNNCAGVDFASQEVTGANSNAATDTNTDGADPSFNENIDDGVDGGVDGNTSVDPTLIKGDYTVPAVQVGMADIVFLVDTSGSMQSIQNQIGNRFQDFIDSISSGERQIDWRIGITTANMQAVGGPAGSRGQLISVPSSSPNYYLQADQPNIAADFLDMITLPESRPESQGNDNDDDERAIYNANLLVDNRNMFPGGFFREGADLHMVIVSNENERSDGRNLENKDLPDTLIANVRDNVFDNKFYVHSIVDLNDSSIYQELSNKTNGEIQDIDTNDYSGALDAIGNQIANNSGTQVTLECVAKDLGLTLTPEPMTPPEYQVQGKTLTFSTLLAEGTKINFSYYCEDQQ